MHISDLLSMTVAKGASDLHLKAEGSPVLRINVEVVKSSVTDKEKRPSVRLLRR